MMQQQMWSEVDWVTAEAKAADVSETGEVVARRAADGVPPTAPTTGEEPLALFASAVGKARADRTRSAYEMDWRLFTRWCCEQGSLALPASAETLAQYLVHLAKTGRKTSTIRRARISIGVVHSDHGLPRPCCAGQIRAVERRIVEGDGAKEKGAPPLMVADLERMMDALGNTLRDERDRALLLLGFAGAFRSCELVALNKNDIKATSSGLLVAVRLGTEQSGAQPAEIEIQPSKDPLLCPVTAVERWLSRLPLDYGALFRTVNGSRVTCERLAPRAVSRAIQRAAARAQLSVEYSSHSLRSGQVTCARAQGRSAHDIQMHGRWKDSRSLQRYIDLERAAPRQMAR